jgi:hypothetical protein
VRARAQQQAVPVDDLNDRWSLLLRLRRSLQPLETLSFILFA